MAADPNQLDASVGQTHMDECVVHVNFSTSMAVDTDQQETSPRESWTTLDNALVKVDPETGVRTYAFEFESEPLGMPASKGYGYVQLDFGDDIGGREDPKQYTIVRKLGWGGHSSIWLARDNHSQGFVVIKVLTDYMMKLREEGKSWEREALELVSQPVPSSHCVAFIHDFVLEAPRGSSGPHLCYVMPLYGGDVSTFQKSCNEAPVPYPLAKRIILHVLRGLAHIHSRGVVHTDLKPNNILYTMTKTSSEIELWLERDPPRKHKKELSNGMKIVQAAVSQPLPPPTVDEALNATYLIADFGCAQPSGQHANQMIGTPMYRAPEVWLGGKWDKPADIWVFGCLVYKILTGQPLLQWTPHEGFGLTEEEHILYQMIIHAKEQFEPEDLYSYPLAPKYIGPDCLLKKDVNYCCIATSRLVLHHNKTAPEKEMQAFDEFMALCIRLSPKNRATAEELLKHPWLAGIE